MNAAPTKPAGVRVFVPKPAQSTVAAVRTQVKSHGRVVHQLAPLIKQGSAAARDVSVMENCLLGGLASQRDIGRARASLERLYEHAQTLPPVDRAYVERALYQRYWRLEFADRKVAAMYSGGLKEFAKTAKGRVFRGIDVAAARAGRKVLKEGHEVMQIAQQLLKRPGVDAEQLKLCARVFSVVPPDSPFWLRAAQQAYMDGPAIWNLMKMKQIPFAARQHRFLGYFANIRSYVGEGVGLLEPAIALERDARFAMLQQEALRLGPGHVALDLNQVQHGLRFADNQPGPDAVQFIYNIPGKHGIAGELFQVKVAKESEGAIQSVGDAFRSVGLFKTGAVKEPVLVFTLPGSQAGEIRLPLVVDPRVPPRLVIVNALDSRMPLGDRIELDMLGVTVDERQVALTVGEFNYATVPVVEASLMYLLKAGKIK